MVILLDKKDGGIDRAEEEYNTSPMGEGYSQLL